MNDTLDNELREIEAQLANLSPTQMPDDMLNRMEQAMIAWETHLPTEEKIVPFNKQEGSTLAPAKSGRNLHTWGAAAAIALFASVTTVFMSGNSQENPATFAADSTKKSSAVRIADRENTNATSQLSRNITHASNEGVTYAGNNENPFKVLRIEYTEKIITHDKDGKRVITEKPCVEHVLVPIPVH